MINKKQPLNNDDLTKLKHQASCMTFLTLQIEIKITPSLQTKYNKCKG